MTIEQGQTQQRYQGYVPLEAETLEAAAHTYFRAPSRSQPASGSRLPRCTSATSGRGAPDAGGRAASSASSCRSGERIEAARPAGRRRSGGGGRSPEPLDDDAWVEAQALLDTVEDHELTDPSIAAERLLYRLFHERGVRVFQPLRSKRTAPARANGSSRCWRRWARRRSRQPDGERRYRRALRVLRDGV